MHYTLEQTEKWNKAWLGRPERGQLRGDSNRGRGGNLYYLYNQQAGKKKVDGYDNLYTDNVAEQYKVEDEAGGKTERRGGEMEMEQLKSNINEILLMNIVTRWRRSSIVIPMHRVLGHELVAFRRIYSS